MTRPEVVKLLIYISNSYPGRMEYPRENGAENDLLEKTWLDFLKEIDLKIALTVVRKYICEGNKWPPSVGEIVAASMALKNPPGLSSLDAWEMVCQAAANFGYYREQEAVKTLPPKVVKALNLMGGFKQVIGEDNQGGWVQKRFELIYNQLAQVESQYEKLPGGLKQELKQIRDQVTQKMLTGGIKNV